MKTLARLACALLMLTAAPCAADEFASPTAPDAPTNPSWCSLSVGMGGASDWYASDVVDDTALMAAVSAQNGRHIFTARYTHLGNWRDDGDVALLYERAFSRRRWLVSAGLGLGLRHATTLGPVYEKSGGRSSERSLGIAWSLEAVTRKHPTLGIGFIAYGSANLDGSLLGLGLVLHAGRLEER